jgi:hypothetical protein
MAATYDEAVAELFRGPHATFVAERKRLAGELKAAGDKTGAATLAKLGRPPISAWAVNQLWWQARAEFDALLETAKRLREGDLSATPAHRQAIVDLRARAATILTEAGNAANEATLRRVATTLSAIAAHGGFAPDPAGALTDDRDPPGFEAAGIPAMGAPAPAPAPAPKAVEAPPEMSEAERRAVEEEEARQEALAAEERKRQEAAVKAARDEVTLLTHEVADLKRAAMEAEGKLVAARARLAELEKR